MQYSSIHESPQTKMSICDPVSINSHPLELKVAISSNYVDRIWDGRQSSFPSEVVCYSREDGSGISKIIVKRFG